MTGVRPGRSRPDPPAQVLDRLAGVPYLRELDARERVGLARRCAVRRVRRGATIFHEGAPAAGLWIVLAGRIKVVRLAARGREQVLHVESAGATLAEVPVFDGGGYVASAVAAEDAEVLFVPRPLVLDLCRRRPQVALAVIQVLARRVRRFAALIEDLGRRDVTARLARLLLAEAAAGAADVDLGGTREEVAARLGTVRELVSRSLARLRALDIVEVRGRRVTVRDRRRLAQMAGVEGA
jgi:CRP/FNR family transcriptional regulator